MNREQEERAARIKPTELVRPSRRRRDQLTIVRVIDPADYAGLAEQCDENDLDRGFSHFTRIGYHAI